jgi:phenylacetate-CoA ligase
MSRPLSFYIPEEESLDTRGLVDLQQRKLAALLEAIASNSFYRNKLKGIHIEASKAALDALPFTTRLELEQDQLSQPPFGTNLTYPLVRYCRFHQTSGTRGRPMRWLDTPESWAWLRRCWGIVFAAAGVGPQDRLFFPFSFGPFLAFWAAFDAAQSMGRLAIPGGGLATAARLRMILDNQVTVVCCTPTYALHMAEVAKADGIDLASSAVRKLIVAGEPGGNIPETRQRLEAEWGARVYDHSGMTETGPMTFECDPCRGGVHVIESEYIPEVIDPASGRSVADGELGELVVTNLGRIGSPLIRYRTGDLVRLTRGRCDCGRWYARLAGGILGRIDDMIIVRGNNVFPSALEAVVRRFTEVAEFRVTVYNSGAMSQIGLEIEPLAEVTRERLTEVIRHIGQGLQEAFHLRAEVNAVAPGSLPRFEMKARRFVRVDGDPPAGEV